MQDRVPQARLIKAWVLPEYTHPDRQYLDLVSDVLAQGKTSRLFKRLVYDDKIATDVGAAVYPFEIAGVLQIDISAQPGVDLTTVEAALDEVYAGDAEHYKVKLQRVRQATRKDLRGAAQRWLASGATVIEVYPFPEYSTTADSVDRSALPVPDSFPTVQFPAIERAALDNGLQVLLVQRSAVPVVGFRLVVDAGHASDQLGLLGTSSLAVGMMEEGTSSRDALQISDELATLGATFGVRSSLDQNVVTLSALKDNLDASLDVFADIVLHPAFPADQFERVRSQRLAAIQREKAAARSLAMRLYPPLLFGDGHAYGLPLTGTGTEASIAAMTRGALAAFHKTWFRPNNATLVVVGATTLAEILPKLERRFGKWARADVPTKNLAPVARRTSAEVFVVDRPESEQSMIYAVHLAPPKANVNDIANEALNDILGGNFTARLNMNLREDKHWAYYARSQIVSIRGPGAYTLFSQVQTDKTAEAMIEVQRELSAIVGDMPATAEELAKVKDKNTLTLPGRWERNDAVAQDLVNMARFGLADDYWNQFPARIRGLQLEQVQEAAEELLNPDGLLWLIVGDRNQIEASIRALGPELGFDDIQLLDTDGNRL